MIKNKVEDNFIWILEIYIKVIGKMVKNMDLEDILLQMEIIMMDNSFKEWDLVKESINGLMEVITMENGKLTKWMEEVLIEVLMEQLQKDFSKMII